MEQKFPLWSKLGERPIATPLQNPAFRQVSMISRQDSSVTCIAESAFSLEAKLNYFISLKEGSVRKSYLCY